MYSYNDYLMHYGRLGMKWGVMNGPPYPLDAKTRRTLKREVKNVAKDNGHRFDFQKTRREKERLVEASNKLNEYAQYRDEIRNQQKAEKDIIEKYGLDKIERKYVELALLQDVQMEARETQDTEFKERFKGLNGPNIDSALLNNALDYISQLTFGVDSSKKLPKIFETLDGENSAIASPLAIKLIDSGFSDLKKIDKEIKDVAANAQKVRDDFLMEILDKVSPAGASKAAKQHVNDKLRDSISDDRNRVNLSKISLTEKHATRDYSSPSYVSKTKRLIEAYDAGRK